MSIWFVMISILFSISTHLTRKQNIQILKGQKSKDIQQEEQQFEPMWYRIAMVTLTAMRFGSYVGLENQFAGYLTAFAVHGLNLPKTDGLALTSVYRTTFTISRVLNTFIAMWMRPTTMIVIDLIVMIVTYVVLVVTGMYNMCYCKSTGTGLLFLNWLATHIY